MAGVAGALYVPQVGIINPSEFAPANSIEAVIWVAVGGRGTLVGAALGAVLVNFGKTYLHRRLPRILAVRPRRALRPRHPVPAQGHPRACSTSSPAGARAPARRPSARSRPRSRSPACAEQADDRRTALTNSLLYLDDVRVSFDGYKALRGLSLTLAAGRDARHHRPQRRRQDHDDGRHHRQDAARRGRRSISAARPTSPSSTRPTIAELGIGRKFQKPTVFENHTVETTSCWP